MARNISVKVPTSALVAQIEERIAEIDKSIADYPADRAKYEKAQEKYQKDVVKATSTYLSKNGSKVGTDLDSPVRVTHRYYGSVELTINTDAIEGFPKKPEPPEQPNQRESFGREYTTRKSILEKNLRILKMTTQEEVSASTYGAILEIL